MLTGRLSLGSGKMINETFRFKYLPLPISPYTSIDATVIPYQPARAILSPVLPVSFIHTTVIVEHGAPTPVHGVVPLAEVEVSCWVGGLRPVVTFEAFGGGVGVEDEGPGIVPRLVVGEG